MSFCFLPFCLIRTAFLVIFKILIEESIVSPCLAVMPLIVARLDLPDVHMDDNFNVFD